MIFKMKHLILLFIILLCFNEIIYSQDFGILKGKIIDSISMKPIEFCVITIQGKLGIKKSKYTDISGDYEFYYLPKNKYWLYYSYLKQRNVLFDSIDLKQKVNIVSIFCLNTNRKDSEKQLVIENCEGVPKKTPMLQIKIKTNLFPELERKFTENNKCLFDGYFVSTKTSRKIFVLPYINIK